MNSLIGRGSRGCVFAFAFFPSICFSVPKPAQLTCLPKNRISHYKSPLIFYIMHIKKKDPGKKSIYFSGFCVVRHVIKPKNNHLGVHAGHWLYNIIYFLLRLSDPKDIIINIRLIMSQMFICPSFPLLFSSFIGTFRF